MVPKRTHKDWQSSLIKPKIKDSYVDYVDKPIKKVMTSNKTWQHKYGLTLILKPKHNETLSTRENSGTKKLSLNILIIMTFKPNTKLLHNNFFHWIWRIGIRNGERGRFPRALSRWLGPHMVMYSLVPSGRSDWFPIGINIILFTSLQGCHSNLP